MVRYNSLWGKRRQETGGCGMEDLAKEFRRLREDDPDLALVLDAYREIRRGYREVQRARRIPDGGTAGSSSSAKVIISVGQPTSLSNY